MNSGYHAAGSTMNSTTNSTTVHPAISRCSAHCIELEGQRIDYRIRISPLAKRCKIRVSLDGVEVVLPYRVSLKRAVSMLREHGAWVVRQVEHQQHRVAASAALLPENTILLRGEPTQVEIIRTASAGGLAQVDHRDGRLRVRYSSRGRPTPPKSWKPGCAIRPGRILRPDWRTAAWKCGNSPAVSISAISAPAGEPVHGSVICPSTGGS